MNIIDSWNNPKKKNNNYISCHKRKNVEVEGMRIKLIVRPQDNVPIPICEWGHEMCAKYFDLPF